MSGFRNVGIAGATGAVGAEIIQLLEERNFPAERYTLLASSRSAGTSMTVQGKEYVVEDLATTDFSGMDIALFSAGGDRSREHAPRAAEAGTLVIDNSSAFRMDPNVPLVVPEINPEAARQHKGIIANPNCSTIIMAVAIWPLHKANPIRRMVVSTYQSASGAGASAMKELEDQTRAVLAGKPAEPKAFPYQIAFNLFCHNTPIKENGYNEEEMKMVNETRKIFDCQEIQISATCVRVPVYRAHSEAINLTFERPISEEEVRVHLDAAPGVTVVDQRDEPQHFPMPIEADGKDDVYVGRIRKDISQPEGCGIDLFLSGDQLRKGAALNAIQIAELFV